MTKPVQAPYGSWRSPVTADLIAEGSVGLGQIALDGDSIYWTEVRPSEAGRTVIVRRDDDGMIRDMTPPDFSVRTRVHEYGGGAFAVHGGTIWFCNDPDQQVYRQAGTEAPVPLTAAEGCRFADLTYDPVHRRIVAVREDHGGAGEPENTLVAIDEGGAVSVLASGADFYAAPRPSPDGTRLAWLAWDHPNMPWDGCTLTVARLDGAGGPEGVETVAGGPDEALFQPEWTPDGGLCFVSDRSGWWNLYCWQDGDAHALLPLEAEFGLPQWIFNMRTYGIVDDNKIISVYQHDGVAQMTRISPDSGEAAGIDLPYVDLQALVVSGRRAAFLGGSRNAPQVLVALDLTTGQTTTLRTASAAKIDENTVSAAQPVTYESAGGRHAHAYYYPPKNADFVGLDGALPPLIVKSHGGPTGQSSGAFNLKTQYWTSRGFAVLDVNYGGSTGYGRAYRRLLDREWGVVDVEDCVAGARWAMAQGLADGARLAITGGSAGGYTTLCALTFFDVFKAGASHYGIGDLEALARDTHKFESRYLDRLIGAWPADKAIYDARSPIHHADGLDCPVVFFQGADDKVVPPNQAEAMVSVLREKGIPVAYVLFEGEGHGFRRAENIRRALEGELAFYGCIFGFAPADDLQPIEIENLG